MAENIASLQKVALVKGFSFEQSEELASRYPFAIIFSDGNPTGHNKDVPAIFNGEYRYTRFINVNPARNEIQVNDHTIILTFEYDSGLLSIGDKYVLDNIRIIRLSYVPFFGSIETDEYSYGDGGDFDVDAKDNKFKLEIEFFSNDDISYISKELYFDYNEYVQYVGYNVNSLGTIGIYYFNVRNNCNNLPMMIRSTYANNVSINNFNFGRIRLNPQYLHIYEDGINIDNKDTLLLDYNETINLKALLACDIQNTIFEGFEIRIENKPSYLSVDTTSNTNSINFTLRCTDIDTNAYLTGSFDINVYRDGRYVSHLSKHYRIEVKGEFNDALWYIGNIDPELLTQQDLMPLTGSIGYDVQNAYQVEYYTGRTEYFIISNNYDGIKNSGPGKVYPRNNFYKRDNENKIYCSAKNWVNDFGSININGVTMNVYRFKNDILFNGKFYGKIQ